MQMQLKQPGYI